MRRFLFRRLPKSMRHSLIRSRLTLNYYPPKNLKFKIAESHEELEAAFQLLYRSYVDAGYMETDQSGMRITFFHLLPSTTTLIALWDDEVVGTVSIFRDNSEGLPLESDFDINHLRKNGNVIAEISSLAVAPKFRSQQGMILLPLLKYLWVYSKNYFGLDGIVMATNPKLADFFEGVILFDRIPGAPVQNYGFANGSPAIAGYLDLNQAPIKYSARYGDKKDCKNLYKFMVSDVHLTEHISYPDRTDTRISDPIIHPQLLSELFFQNDTLLNQLTQQQTVVLLHHYGNQSYRTQVSEIETLCSKLHLKDMRLGSSRHETRSPGKLSKPFEQTGVGLEVRNCSLRGLRIFSASTLDTDQIYHLKVAVTDDLEIQLTVKLAWKSLSGYAGLKIIRAPEEWTQYIEGIEATLPTATAA